jgi:MurNAc alpha-1-phosphate uridylyltransferase
VSAAPERALVFAAGLGTRMRPITLSLPKPLVRIGGKPMIDHMLDRLEDAGVKEAIVMSTGSPTRSRIIFRAARRRA